MRTTQLAVIQIEGSWCMLLNGERVGRFARRTDALGCAIDVGNSADHDGAPVEVLVQDQYGQITALPLKLTVGGVRA